MMVPQQHSGVYRLLRFLLVLSSVHAFRQVEVSGLEDTPPGNFLLCPNVSDRGM